MSRSGPVDFIPAGHSGTFAERWFYKRVGYRAPKKGEFYLSGAIVQAWQAPNDLPETCQYHVVEKTYRAERVTVEIPDLTKR